jgi:hypothetical protein
MPQFKLVTFDKEFRFKKLCPYCNADLIYRVTGWEEKEDGWIADSIESDDFEDWLNNHSELPYIYQLPVDERVKKYINDKFRFDLNRN